MKIVSLRNGVRFSVNADESILDAALRSNISLEHSCKIGRCGTCIALVVQGGTENVGTEVSLSDADRRAGRILTCARTALSDIELDIEDLGALKLYPAKVFPARVNVLKMLNDDVMQVIVRTPPGNYIRFRAGQHVSVANGAGVRRSYSIASAPQADHQFELHIKRVDDGVMSRFWFEEAKVNDLVRVNGPLGTFVLRPSAGMKVIFVATGVGIAPIKAILGEMASGSVDELPEAVTVIWGGRRAEDLYWDPVSLGIPLTYVPVLSRAGGDLHGERGWVQDVLARTCPMVENVAVYACGNPDMIRDVGELVNKVGRSRARFFADAFVSSGG